MSAAYTPEQIAVCLEEARFRLREPISIIALEVCLRDLVAIVEQLRKQLKAANALWKSADSTMRLANEKRENAVTEIEQLRASTRRLVETNEDCLAKIKGLIAEKRALDKTCEQLRAEVDHFKRCNDPENCFDDPVTMDGTQWRGCTENIRLAMERARREPAQ
jgi:DNA anti-recombination protein RmuC